MCAVGAMTSWMSGRGYAEGNLPSPFANSFGTLDHFRVDCRAEVLAQELHQVILMKDTGLEEDSPASSVPLTSSTSEVTVLDPPNSDSKIPALIRADLDRFIRFAQTCQIFPKIFS